MDNAEQDSFALNLTQLEEKINKRARQGLLLILPLVFFPVILVIFSEMIDDGSLFAISSVFLVLAIGSFGYSLHWGSNGRKYIYGLKIVNLISPPYPYLGKRIAIIDRTPIYIIVRWGATNLLFIRLLEPEIATEGKIQLPRLISRNDYTHEIDGIEIARREGSFMFPRSPNGYIMGDGILYGLRLQRNFWVPKKNPISAEIVLNIVRQLNLDLAQKKDNRS